MQIKIFTFPVSGNEESELELNRFLQSNRILQLDRSFCSENGGYWTFCIVYMENAGKDKSNSFVKKDYKNELTESQFLRFTRFREIRRELARSEGIPAYVVFTDEELAQICRLEEITEGSIEKLRGVGKKRAERYGSYFVQSDETTGKLV